MAERLSTGLADAINVTGSVKTIMANGVIRIYSGTQPATADDAETGTLLGKLTVGGAAFTPGNAAAGLNLAATSTNGVVSKAAGETWSGVGLPAASTGTTAGWFRWYDNNETTGASTTARRMDGNIGTNATNEMQMSNPVIAENSAFSTNTFTYSTTKA